MFPFLYCFVLPHVNVPSCFWYHLETDFLIQIESIIGSQLVGHVEGTYLSRIYYYLGSDATIDVNWMEKNAIFLFNTISGNRFRVTIDLSKIDQTSYAYFLAVDTLTSRRVMTIYRIEKALIGCNQNLLEISNVEDLHDSCAAIAVYYHGKGDIYVLVVPSSDDTPSTEGIVNEGIYLGRYVVCMCFC